MIVRKKARAECECQRRWGNGEIVVMKLYRQKNDQKPRPAGILLHVPWKKTRWPFPPDHTHFFSFHFSTAKHPDPRMVIRVDSKVGLGRCACGNVVAYGSTLQTHGPFTRKETLELIYSAPGKDMRDIMWARVCDLTAELHREGRDTFRGVEYLP